MVNVFLVTIMKKKEIKRMKKFMMTLLAIIMVLNCTITAHAADAVPVLTLEANEYNSNGERHIKVTWEGKSGTYQIQLADNENFDNPTVKTRSRKQGMYWNFVISENVEATYYIRVRLVNGEWSNVVVASMEEPIETESTPYFSVPKLPTIPDISGSVQAPTIKFDFSQFKFPTIISE